VSLTEPFDDPQEESRGDDKERLESLQRYWLREIGRYEKQYEKFTRNGEKIVKLLRRQEETRVARRFAMLWANTDVLRPAVYARVPVPIVSRRFKDNDPVGLFASEVIERNLSYEIERGKLHETLKLCRDDMLLPGRGTMWVRMVDKDQAYKCLYWDFVHWKDFGHTVARTWAEVTAVWRRVFMTKRQLADRFFGGDMEAEELGEIQLDHSADIKSSQESTNPAIGGGQAKATVYEIWDRKTGQMLAIAKGGDVPLEVAKPYLDLKSFWPCPQPLYSTLSTESLEPTPDYIYYQDQAEEIDVLTGRIAALSDVLKLVGWYPGGENESDISAALNPNVQNRLIAVENWAAFGEKGLAAQIVWLPIGEVVQTVTACIQLRTQLIQDVFQIMGLSDIQRGASSPEETLGAQQLKAQYGSNRLKSKRDEITRFAQEAIEIGAEIIAENFSPQQILAVANREQADPGLVAAAMRLMRDDHIRCFRIDVETDSTVYPDEQQEKASRNEFMMTTAQFLQQAGPIAQAIPSAMPLIGELLMFVLRGYRVGREMEATIEQTLQSMQQEIIQKQQQPPPSDPVEQRRAENDSSRLQIENKKVDGDLDIRRQELGIKQQDIGLKQDTLKNTKEDSAYQKQLAMIQELNQMVGDELSQESPEPTPEIQQKDDQFSILMQTLMQQNQMIAGMLSAPKVTKLIIDPTTGDPIGAESQTVMPEQASGQ
jgi:hypothetical protein